MMATTGFDHDALRRVLNDVAVRRADQALKGYTAEHDDEHVPADFSRFITRQLLKLDGGVDPREAMLDVAALAVAAIEALDRKSRG